MRRSRPPPAARPAGRRPVLFPRVQRQQEVDHGQPEIAARARAGEGDADARPMSASRTSRPARSSGWASATTWCSAINPASSTARSKGFGAGSPYENNLAFDMIAQACGGTISVTGEPDGPPVKPGISLGDTGTGMLMAITILGALFAAQRDRPGQSAAGGDAGRDAALHAHQLRHPGAHRQAGRSAAAARCRAATTRRRACIPCKPGGPNDYVYIMTSRANPEHWDAAAEADRPRGPDRRSALRHAGRPGEARGRGGRDHRRLDAPAHQARGDGS